MEILQCMPADHIVAAFLKAEIDSPRNTGVHAFLDALGLSRQLVDEHDLMDATENHQRRAVLGARGYPNTLLFEHLPPDIEWHAGLATRQEITLFRYGAEATYPAWWTLSSGTGVVADGAAGIDRVGVDGINQQIRDDAEAIRGGHDRGPLIVVSARVEGPMVLLDGCCRATAYALARDDGPSHVAVIVGLSGAIRDWVHWPR